MITGLKPYAEYQDFAANWCGSVPSHWNLKRIGSIFGERGETNEQRKVIDILSVLKGRGVIPYAEKGRIGNKASDDIGRYKVVRPDDLVVNCMNVIIGSLGRSRYTGCLSPVYYVLRRRDLKNDPRYLELIFQNKPFHESLVRIGNGILAHRMRIPMEKLKAEVVPLPPPVEQTAIVRFLTWANGRLERAIRSKRKVIALLNEQKQAIIHRAVTRGLDPDVALKPSGVPWIGEIPAHWEVKRLKNWVSINTRTIGENTAPDFEFDYIDIASVATGKFSQLPKRLSFKNSPSRARRVLKQGDTIVSTVRTYLKAVVTVGEFDTPLIASTGFAVLTPRVDTKARYLGYVIQAEVFTNQVTAESVGIAYPAISESRLGNIFLALPQLAEQEEIERFLDTELAGFINASTRLQREITLLLEYRTRLVADVVTGKLDVREAVAKLPDDIPLDAALEAERDDDKEILDEEASE